MEMSPRERECVIQPPPATPATNQHPLNQTKTTAELVLMALNKSLDHANTLSQVSLTSLQLVVAAQGGQPMQMMGAGPSTGPLLQIMGPGPSM